MARFLPCSTAWCDVSGMPMLTSGECVAQFTLPVAPRYQSRPDPEHAEPLGGKALRRLYPPPLAPGFGARVRRAREEACMPVGALAHETGIDVTVPLDFERETREPTHGQLRRIAAEVGANYDELRVGCPW